MDFVAKTPEERLEGVDPARHALILKREAEEGVILDPLTGYPLKVDLHEEEVEWLPDMTFWIALDRELIGDRNENGFVGTMALDARLDRWGIMDEDNRVTSQAMLDQIATGRNMAAMESLPKA